MRYAITCDFGSTYTKARVINLDDACLIRSGQAATTAATDLRDGLGRALAEAGGAFTLEGADYRAGCSSAAGGLRMIAVGLVPDLTVAAAREAALGAGARLVGTYAHRLTDDDIDQIKGPGCDVVLLAGGTDGGDAKTVIHNAERLAEAGIAASVVYAGNREARSAACASLRAAGVNVVAVENVLPTLQQLNVAPARAAIRDLFLDRIVVARGMTAARDALDGRLVPTPHAVLEGARLLAEGSTEPEGKQDVMVVDLGGATTDVHSVATGAPSTPGVIWQGIPEPVAKRTVEGDLGLRVNAPGIAEQLAANQGLHQHLAALRAEDLDRYAQQVANDVSHLPEDGEERAFDLTLAALALDVAVGRHVGRVRRVYGTNGGVWVQHGKDLGGVRTVVGTGGIFANHHSAVALLEKCLARPELEGELRPVAPDLYLDTQYVMSAAGLLASAFPDVAQGVLQRSLQPALAGREQR